MSSGALRIALAGAAGALGREIVDVLAEARVPIGDFLPFTTERSAGQEVDLAGEGWTVESRVPELDGLDALILATPAAASRELSRLAIGAGTPCIDASGAFAALPEVPLLGTGAAGCEEAARRAAFVSIAPGPALAPLRILAALREESPLRRLSATVLAGVATAGQGGIEALSEETIALLSTREPPEPVHFREPVAFDCWPDPGSLRNGAGESPDLAVAAALQRALGEGVAISVTSVLVPTFVGCGTLLSLETAEPVTPAAAAARLAKSPQVEVVEPELPGPSLRESASQETVRVGCIRPDPSRGACGLQLWLSADPLRLAAIEAVRWVVRRSAH